MVSSLLPEQARRNGDARWLMVGDRTYTFSEGHDLVSRYASGLASLGIGHGDIVAIMMDNTEHYVFTSLALAHLGAIQVSINTAYRGEFLRRILEDCAPSTMIAHGRYGDHLSPAMIDLPGVKSIVVHGSTDTFDAGAPRHSMQALIEAGRTPPPAAGQHTDTMSISFTSGTTGRSKGVVQTNAYWINAANTMAISRDIRADDVFHLCTPMFHSRACLLNVFPSLIYGLPVALEPRFSIRDFWPSVRRHGATQIFTLSATHIWLLNQPEPYDDLDTPARASTPLPPSPPASQPPNRPSGP